MPSLAADISHQADTAGVGFPTPHRGWDRTGETTGGRPDKEALDEGLAVPFKQLTCSRMRQMTATAGSTVRIAV